MFKRGKVERGGCIDFILFRLFFTKGFFPLFIGKFGEFPIIYIENNVTMEGPVLFAPKILQAKMVIIISRAKMV
jgi:hypothetical protein